MREILFRGKRKIKNEWSYGDYFRSKIFNTELGLRVAHSITYYHNDIEHSHIVDPSTIGQYTGLTDKKDNMIFEGDILSANLDDLFPDNETRLVVEWHDNGWYGKNGNMYDDFLNEFNKMFEVIGNIHDNPELIIKEN